MSKPMYCPMSFNRDIISDGVYCKSKPMECTPDCAWAINDKENYWCGIVPWNIHARNNVRPIENE